MRIGVLLALASCAVTPIAAHREETFATPHFERRGAVSLFANGDELRIDHASCVTLRANEVVRTCAIRDEAFARAIDGVVAAPDGALRVDQTYGAPGTEDPGSLWVSARADDAVTSAIVRSCDCGLR